MKDEVLIAFFALVYDTVTERSENAHSFVVFFSAGSGWSVYLHIYKPSYGLVRFWSTLNVEKRTNKVYEGLKVGTVSED